MFHPADVLASNFDSLEAHRQILSVVRQQRLKMQVFTDLTNVIGNISQILDSIQLTEITCRQHVIISTKNTVNNYWA